MQEGLRKGKGKKFTREINSKILDKEKNKNKKAEKSETTLINSTIVPYPEILHALRCLIHTKSPSTFSNSLCTRLSMKWCEQIVKSFQRGDKQFSLIAVVNRRAEDPKGGDTIRDIGSEDSSATISEVI